jgi:hypothetical protein
VLPTNKYLHLESKTHKAAAQVAEIKVQFMVTLFRLKDTMVVVLLVEAAQLDK